MTTSPHHTPEAGILSEEIIAKAADALRGVCVKHGDTSRRFTEEATACLTAALPDLIEACAKVAEDRAATARTAVDMFATSSKMEGAFQSARGRYSASMELAEAIRSLSHPVPKEGE